MSVEAIEPDDARAWSVRQALEATLDELTEDHTQAVILF